ncbi:hypothetical protein TPHA_0A04220 [Tetrapisispora phaffii CBS 4417]|uniref:ABC transporter domain-containing protein n=1 Tax=Tetrapisispora phaffii (strain ATCC 24235 / CBS 4417 / NBRC 1672 / NRRL Y-8282 / UCD 70-5) TaxID=1071381 RepID=G8BNL9_TETPH|nr:hypothetical protein TPHA_0A04220 [Tetrapisispora phaffii CBS 4417]CCE61497.1 hypothetical protein TPHA_0A04220 [Tetrapisispora phaffii CBS 4417]
MKEDHTNIQESEIKYNNNRNQGPMDDEASSSKLSYSHVSDIGSHQTTTSEENLDNISRYIRSISSLGSEESKGHLELSIHKEAKTIIKNFVKDAKEQGMHIREAGVIIKDLSMEVADRSTKEGKTFADVLLFPLTLFRELQRLKHTPKKKILKSINGVAEPGKIVLVLGKPGSGSTTLLKIIAGEGSQCHGKQAGTVLYEGISQEEMIKKYKSDLIYNGEDDVHFPHLTVQQTLDFAISCKIPEKRVNNISKKEYLIKTRELLATIFGLENTYNTKVGNEYVRGISGGERKRVSLAEAMCLRGTVYCWDNATRGLDASTALEYAQAVRIITNLLNSTAFISLYQPSEKIYNSFDDVTVLYQGRQVYFGPTTDAKNYFEKMGYECPPRQSTAEFLTSVTDLNGYHKFKDGFEKNVPKTAIDFENYWVNSPEYQELLRRIQNYEGHVNPEKAEQIYDTSIMEEKPKYSQLSSHYMITYFEQVRICTIRGFQRIYGDMNYTVINIVAAVIQAFIIGSLFYNTPVSTTGAFSRGGILYFALLYYSLMGLASVTFDQKLIVHKHKSYCLYHPSAEALASTIAAFPFRLIGLTLFLIILYFLSNLRRTPSAFFIIYLFLIIGAESINCLFQMIGAACNTLAQANAINGILMLSLSMYSTYMIQLPQIKPWFIWIAYILPLRYAFEAMLLAEFHGRNMDCGGTLVPSGSGYSDASSQHQVCAFIGSEPGQNAVLGDNYLEVQYEYKYSHLWRNFGILWCFLLGYLVIRALITEFKPTMSSNANILILKKGIGKHRLPSDEEAQPLEYSEETNSIGSNYNISKKTTTTLFRGLQSTEILRWSQVSYTIPFKTGDKQLLNNISGYCVPGKLTALMGESGAGKTTLLNVLSKRNEFGIITGDISVGDTPIDSSFERRIGYVQQQDVHIAELTVRESLQFSARLRRPESISDDEKLEYVEDVLEILDMEEYADALVGEVGMGLNVEQRKKLSIGVELAAKPDLLLFLDEPTSGLDSQSAWAIVRLLKRLSQSGQSILCTIHQPSATLFEVFDRLLLLQKGGETVYFGDIGKNSNTLIRYFENHGARKCEVSENPAEYILDVIGAGATTHNDVSMADVWVNSEECKNSEEDLANLITEGNVNNEHGGNVSKKYATSYWYQFKYVQARTFTIFWRDLNYLVSKLMLFMVGGLYIGFTFFHVDNSFIGLQNSLFAAFIAIILSAPSINQIQSRAIISRDLFEVRESKSNMFHWSLLVLTEYIAELPFHLFVSTIFFVSFYFPVGLFFEASRSAVFFLNYCIVFQLFFIALGLLVLYLSPDIQSANVLMGLVISMLVAFCGVVQPEYLMPGFWTFMFKASPYTYFVQNLVGIMLHEKPVICTSKEYSYFNPPPGQTCGEYMQVYLNEHTGYINNPESTTNCAYCTYSVGDQYLARIGAHYSNLWRNFGFFWAFILFNIGAMLAVYYLFHVKNLGFQQKENIRYFFNRIRQFLRISKQKK